MIPGAGLSRDASLGGSRVSGAIDVEFSHEADDRLIAGILKALPHVG